MSKLIKKMEKIQEAISKTEETINDEIGIDFRGNCLGIKIKDETHNFKTVKEVIAFLCGIRLSNLIKGTDDYGE